MILHKVGSVNSICRKVWAKIILCSLSLGRRKWSSDYSIMQRITGQLFRLASPVHEWTPMKNEGMTDEARWVML